MAFIDELQFHIKAGNGGNGVVRWLHQKGKEYGGPSGGNGGRGGAVIAVGDSDIGILAKYRHEKTFEAERGEDGKNNSMTGHDGADLKIRLPIGSVITNLETGESFELLHAGQEIKILEGGRGGLGNEHFKSSVNQNPQESTEGKVGEEADFKIELQLIAHAGFIGFPNAGKSSLLNLLTRASAKVGNFQFTTLDPNLGAFYKFILADIPGLIEGASDGRGLGIKFLRHVRRTGLLIHCISLESEDIVHDYDIIRKEIESYDVELAKKDEIILLTKTDMKTPDDIEEIKTKIAKHSGREVLEISIYDDGAIKKFSDYLSARLTDISQD